MFIHSTKESCGENGDWFEHKEPIQIEYYVGILRGFFK